MDVAQQISNRVVEVLDLVTNLEKQRLQLVRENDELVTASFTFDQKLSNAIKDVGKLEQENNSLRYQLSDAEKRIEELERLLEAAKLSNAQKDGEITALKNQMKAEPKHVHIHNTTTNNTTYQSTPGFSKTASVKTGKHLEAQLEPEKSRKHPEAQPDPMGLVTGAGVSFNMKGRVLKQQKEHINAHGEVQSVTRITSEEYHISAVKLADSLSETLLQTLCKKTGYYESEVRQMDDNQCMTLLQFANMSDQVKHLQLKS